MIVLPDGWANLWNCPSPLGGNSGFWWCGDRTGTPCQTGKGGQTFGVSWGKLMTILPISQSSSSTYLSPTTSATGIIKNSPSLVVSQSVITVSAAPSPGTISKDSNSKTPIAIEASVGIALGIAALGLLAFLLWREQNLRRERQQVNSFVPTPQESRYRESPLAPYRELGGNPGGSELVAPLPVHEMGTKSTYGHY